MAQRVTVVLEDDIDGGKAEEQVSFALNGVEYEIDLSERNATKLKDALAVYIAHARRVNTRKRRGNAARESGSPSEIRAWAQANGIEVNARGRVPAEVREAYLRDQK